MAGRGLGRSHDSSLMDLANDITLLENSQERNNDYDSFAAKYLNLHDQIALTRKKIIRNDIANYFDSHFAAALAILEKEEYKKYRSGVDDLVEWCKGKGIKASTAPEPYRTKDVSSKTDVV